MRDGLLLRTLSCLSLAAALGACATTDGRPPADPAPTASAVVAAHDNLNATLWMQHSAEYVATLRGVFAQAEQQLDAALADPDWDALPIEDRRLGSGFEDLPPAIIVDADETLIDNSPFQARAIRDNQPFELQRWEAWTNERRARALPGALEFARHAAERGVTVFYVTNRGHEKEHDATADNLRALGFPVSENLDNLLLLGDPRAPAREKGERRKWVGERYRVLLMLGDNLGDFIDGVSADADTRARRAAPYAQWWGKRWFMLPNPAYGSWESAIQRACDLELRQRDARACARSTLRTD